MDQDCLRSSLEKQLDQAESVLNTFVLIAIIALFAAISRADPIKAGGFEIPREDAFFVLGLTFAFANYLITVVFLRIGDIVELIDRDNIEKGLSIIALHKWLFNPFSFFGDGIMPRIYSSTGFGCVIIMWWVGFSALQAVHPYNMTLFAVYTVLDGIYLVIGLATMVAINRVYRIILKKCDDAKLPMGISKNTPSARPAKKNTPSARPANQIQRISLNLTNGSVRWGNWVSLI